MYSHQTMDLVRAKQADRERQYRERSQDRTGTRRSARLIQLRIHRLRQHAD